MIAPATVAAADISLVTLVPRVFLSMLIVVGLMWLAARLLKNRQVPGSGVLRQSPTSKQAPALQIIAKQGMGGKTAIAIVRAGDKELVVGITDSNVSLLTELEGTTPPFRTSAGAKPKVDARFGDQGPKEMKRQGTGASGYAVATASTSARKGLLESVREMTVRK